MIIKPNDIELRSYLVLLEPIEVQTEGFMRAQSSEDKPYVGRIVNTGDGGSYSIGDVVLVAMHATSTLSFNGKMYYLTHEDDILGKIKSTD